MDIAQQLPDDLNPEVVTATAEFIGKITGLVPPPHNAFPPEWYGYLRAFTGRLYEIARENTALPSDAAQAPLTDAQIATLADKWSARWRKLSAWNTRRCIDNALREARELIAAPVAPDAAAPALFYNGDTKRDPELRERVNAPLVATAQPDERAAFEAWAKPRGYDLTRCSPEAYSAYKSDFTNGALAGWFGAHKTPLLSTETVDKPVQSMSDTARDRDAARYRWLRQHRLFPSTSTFTNAVELDIAIDAARKGAEA